MTESQETLEPTTTFIYGLWDPRDCRLRYIGKSNHPQQRLVEHIMYAKSANPRLKSRLCRWIRVLSRIGLQPDLEILSEVRYEVWKAEESAWILACREAGLDLVNLTQGGEGISGYRHTAETKKKIARAGTGRVKSESVRRILSEKNPWRGKAGWMRGKKFTEEHCRKISESHKGQRNPNWGRKWSEEIIESRVSKLRGIPRSPEVRERISLAQKGRRFSAEHMEKLQQARLKGCSEETRKRLSQAWIGRRKKWGPSGRL